MTYLKFNNINIVLLLFIGFLAISPSPVYAYLDPGSGSYFMQFILGGILGGLISLKIFWRKIKIYLNKFLFRARKKPLEVSSRNNKDKLQ